MKRNPLTDYYTAQTALFRLERQTEEVSEAVKQAAFDLREAQEALLLYQQSIKALLDRLSGKKQDREEILSRTIREAKAKKGALLREQEALTRQKAELAETLKALPSQDTFDRDAAWAQLERDFCAEVLLLKLEENHEALLEYRKLLRGEFPILSLEERQEMTSLPNIRAKECIPWLQRMKEALDILDVPFSLGGYYEAPDAWLFGVAADHNRRDRVNSALDQVEEVRRQVSQYR